jgi:hypothetical protein
MHVRDSCNSLNTSSYVFLGVGIDTLLTAPAASTSSPDIREVDVLTEEAARSVFPQKPNLLQSAKTIAQRIEGAQIQKLQGVHRFVEPGRTPKSTATSATTTAFRRTSETVLFFLQLARATGDAQNLRAAAEAADHLIAVWQDLVDKQVEGLLTGRGVNLSFCGGIASAAYALSEMGKATGNEKFSVVARAVTDYIVQAAKSVGSGFAWSDVPGIAGDGSIVLYLLYAAREFGSALYGITAERAGDHILELATHERNGGFSWRGFPAFPGLPKDAYLPAFEDSTAGIAYVFARLYCDTKKARFLFAAKQGALHLQAVAPPDNRAACALHLLSDLPESQHSRFCHGPAGIARVFLELYKITREPSYQVRAEQITQALLQWGSPENLTLDHWNSVCQCCGSVAVVDLVIEMWASTGRLNFFTSAQRAVHQLVIHGMNLNGSGNHNLADLTHKNFWEVSAENGDYTGTAGVGLALLHMHLAEQGRYGAIIRLDNPCTN